MWHLLHKSLVRIRSFFAPIGSLIFWSTIATRLSSIPGSLLFSGGLHVVLLLVMMISLREDALHLDFQLPSDARVVCVPSFMVPAHQSYRVGGKKGRGGKQSTAVQENKPAVAPTEAAPEKAESAARVEKMAKKALSSAALAPRDRTTINFDSPRDTESGSRRKGRGKKGSKRGEKKEPLAAARLPTSTGEVKGSKASSGASIANRPQKEALSTAAVDESEGTPSGDGGEENIIYVDQQTYRSYEIAQQVQQAISQHWSPPPGMRSDLACSVKLSIGATGNVLSIEIVKKSGVAVFDMAARIALKRDMYPKAVWNRIIIVHFSKELACGTQE